MVALVERMRSVWEDGVAGVEVFGMAGAWQEVAE